MHGRQWADGKNLQDLEVEGLTVSKSKLARHPTIKTQRPTARRIESRRAGIIFAVLVAHREVTPPNQRRRYPVLRLAVSQPHSHFFTGEAILDKDKDSTGLATLGPL